MATITFDTLKFVETLEKSGVSREQASAIATAVRDSHDAAELATKGDIREFELNFKHEISDLRKDIASMEQRMAIKLGSMIGVAVAFVGVLIKFF